MPLFAKIKGFAKKAFKSAQAAKSVNQRISDSEAVNKMVQFMMNLPLMLMAGLSIVFILFLIMFVTIIAYVLVSAFSWLGWGSSSSSAASGSAGAYLQWATDIANDDSHGYSQCARSGPDYDCSSLVWHALKESGFDENILGTYPFSTFTMGSILEQLGFKEYPYNGHGDLQPGDILLRYNHTGIYAGEDKVVQASIAENGGVCGREGDQTGKEIHVDVDNSSWESYFRLG